ncbi:hypothetical protein XA68_10004 [Ophiocordyceps unilateralis]|uniref:Uncharacterized protein n=1 Tax=Ophiocordyceps unilateralis TaxID=268505 RepID=A0A2A9PPG3_OPHUN|nr:hypothetical protein XA68_10004 [Ophiocordyceps unilateralis]
MVLGIAQDSLAAVSFVVCVVTAPLCLVATLFRFAAAVRIGRRVSIEDWCALAALIVFLAFVALIIWGYMLPPLPTPLASVRNSLRAVIDDD